MAGTPSDTQSAPASLDQADTLVLDAHTFRDLQIFESVTSDASLYAFCNLTHTVGGAQVLRRRMHRPWSKPDKIRATQQSIRFILDHREAFDALPSDFTASRVERYMRELLPVVEHDSLLKFTFGAFLLWVTYDSHYLAIVRGVQFTSELIRVLRRLTREEVMDQAVGEVAPLIEELRELLARPDLARVSETRTTNPAWKTLRLDQGFRVHQKAAVERLVEIAYEIEALVSMADVTGKHHFVIPHLEEGPLRVEAEGLTHPYIERAVANPVSLDQQRRVLFLTGPNMAGKTTYLRAFATAYYLAHLGMGVPARHFRFVPAQRLFSAISLNDDLRQGVSYFRAEALRVKAVAESVAAGYRVVSLMDEPFKGTNIRDAFDASLAILERFAAKDNCLFMFSSHLIELREQLTETDEIDCRYFEAEEQEGHLHFDYRLRPGVSSQRLGMRVLHEEGVFDLLGKEPDSR